MPESVSRLRVLLVASAERERVLRDGLSAAGCETLAAVSSPILLSRAVAETRPEVVVIDTQSPSRETLEHIATVNREQPCPIVVFATDGSEDAIRGAIAAGVTSYVVDGLDPSRFASIIDVAVARFEAHRTLLEELEQAREKLVDRQVIEQAKGILMKARGLPEAEAYRTLRKTAMDRGQRIGEVARQLVDISALLG